MGGRADLRRPADRPLHLLRRQVPATVGPGRPRRRARPGARGPLEEATTRSTAGASSEKAARRAGHRRRAGPGGPAHARPGHPRAPPGPRSASPPSPTRTTSGPRTSCNRNFTASRPDELWVADFTYCSTWSGIVYVAFVIDVFSRRLVGWKAARSMTDRPSSSTPSTWRRGPAGTPDLDGLMCHTDAGSQYTSIALHRAARRRRGRALHRHGRRQLRQRHGRIGHGHLQDRAAPQPRRPGRQRRALEGPRRPRDRHLRLGLVVQRGAAALANSTTGRRPSSKPTTVTRSQPDAA